MNDKSLSVGIVGTSWWADAMYLPALSKHPRARVTAACGRDLQRTQAFAKRWDIPHSFTDFEAMIDSGLIEMLVVATSNKTHYPMTMKALDAGLHVLCEKPLAMSVPEATEMVHKAEQSALKCMVPFTYRFMPTNRHVKRLLDDGYIGKPYHFTLRYYTGYARQGEYLWRFDMAESGGGVIGDLGSHWLYLAQWYFGEIDSVMCMLGQHVPRQPRPDGSDYERADDSATILVQFKSGVQGVVLVSAVCHEVGDFGQSHHMEFHGSEGTLYSFNDWHNTQIVKGSRVGEGLPVEIPVPEDIWNGIRRDQVAHTYKDVFREQDLMVRGLVNAVLDDTPAEPSFAEALAVQRAIAACQLSHREGRRVAVREIG